MSGCCKSVQMAEMVEGNKEAALSFGFEMTWVTDLITKYGGDVLNLVLEAVRGGFSKELVLEVLEKFGPIVLEVLVSVFNRQKMALNMAGDINVADKVDVINSSFLEIILQKYLPLLVEKYGDQIVKMIVDLILNSLKK